jgi:crotonobetainyl-CoA:carnitine CoA-transferase CaiB-like acyl-CoA transferase
MNSSNHPLPLHRLPLKSSPALDLLSGVKVLDLTTSIAGPYAGQLLADLGATVVKIERPGSGDDCRAWGPPFLDGASLWFLSVNRGKRSVALDYSQPEGYEALMALVVTADVILLNLVPRVQKKLRVDSSSLHAVHPGLIHLSLTGFGLTGPRADLPCYDLIAEGYSGVMDLTGENQGAPQKVGTPAADLLSGGDAALAVLAALYRRSNTQQGCAIDISMVETMTRFMSPRLLPYLGSGQLPRRSGGTDSVIAIYQVFETADGPITLGLGNDGIWQRFWLALGEPAIAEDPAFKDNTSRRALRDEIVQRINSILSMKPRSHWLELLAAARVPSGPIYRLDELAEDTMLLDSGFIYSSKGADGPIPQVGLGIRFDGRTEGTTLPPPKLGADTELVLREWAGLDTDKLEQLRSQKII